MKMTLNNLVNLQNETSAVNTINGNNTTITTAFENTLSRDGTEPNQMQNNLDMNSYHILNLGEPSSDTDPVRKIDLTNVSNVTNLIHTASSSTITIGLGAKTFVVPSGLGFFPGQYLLIQDSLDASKYMLGRVTSYAGTSLVMNILSTAGSGTISTWTIDISGPIGTPSTSYDTVSNAIAATIDPTLSFLNLTGYYTIGDGGNGTYRRVVSQPTDTGKFQSADGSWWHLVSNTVTPEMFGCHGDGTTDDYTNFQNCLTFVGVRNGGVVNLTVNKNYRVVVTSGATDGGFPIQPDTVINFNGSTISFEMVGNVIGFRMKNFTTLNGPGSCLTTISSGLSGSQPMYHAPITIGILDGDGGTAASPNPYQFVHDIAINGLTLNSVKNSFGVGTVLCGQGGPYNITIKNNTFPDNAGMSIAIGFDWNYVGTISSADISLSRTNYDAGLAYSTHPHNLLIEKNTIGVYSNPFVNDGGNSGSHGIRLSGVYDSIVRGNDIASTTLSGIFITGGDESFEFCPAALRNKACKGIVIDSNILRECNASFGITFDAFPDNVFAAFQAGTYLNPLNTVDGYPNNFIIQGNIVLATGASVFPGIQVTNTRGGLVCDNFVQGFDTGIFIKTNCWNVSVERNTVTGCNKAGITASDTSFINRNTRIVGNHVYKNCTASTIQGNIFVGSAYKTLIEGNYIGSTTTETSLYGIYIDNVTGSLYTSVINNLVNEVKSSGTAYKIIEAANNQTLWEFRGNTYLGGTNGYLTGLSIIPITRSYSTAAAGILITHAEALKSSLSSGITPSFGTWGLGSTILNIDAAATSDVALTKCIASGTPGTWKAMVTLS